MAPAQPPSTKAFMGQPQYTAQPAAPQQMMVQVTVPPGVMPGQVIAVQSPAGLVQAQVPMGMGPGSTFIISATPTPAPVAVATPSFGSGSPSVVPVG